MKEALNTAVKLAKEFEGFSAKPYACPAGVATIGFGSTAYRDGTPVKLTDPDISINEAEILLVLTMKRCMDSVLKASPTVATNENALAALTDFVYNLGAGRYRASTLKRRINEEDWDEAKYELKRWVRSGGKILPGLVRRREAEAALLP